jgi:hypothetical protein
VIEGMKRPVITDAHALALADELYRATCVRMKKRPYETIGEIANLNGRKVAVLYDDNARLAGAYRVTADSVVDFDGPTLASVRARLQHRKVRS